MDAFNIFKSRLKNILNNYYYSYFQLPMVINLIKILLNAYRLKYL